MKYIQLTPNPSGAYPGPQSRYFPGSMPLTDEQAAMLVSHNGFVTITPEPDKDIKGSAVTVTVNTEAWEAWKAAQPPDPDPEPTLVDRVDELDEALNMILTGYTGEEAADEAGTAE